MDGEAYVLVDDSFAAQGKYREHITFWRRMDGRTWALVREMAANAKAYEPTKQG